MANRISLTEQKKSAFLIYLEASGIVTYACKQIGVTPSTLYDHKGKDPEFSAAWDLAVEAAVDVLEMEARRRASQGVERGVFYQGIKVDTEQHYSDNLLMFLLKGRRPVEFGPGLEGGGGLEQEVEGFDYEDVDT